MKPSLKKRLGYATHIFAFSHCRNVVVEVTKAGGFGVQGAISHTPEHLARGLAWIDRHVGERSYRIDVLMSSNCDKAAEAITGPLIEVSLAHSKEALLSSALGVPPTELAQDLHGRGVFVGGMCGKPEHARHHMRG